MAKVFQGRAEEDLIKHTGLNQVDLIFADPPFNIGYSYDDYEDKLDSNEYLQWSRHWLTECYRALAPAGTFWLAIGDEYAAELKLIAQSVGLDLSANYVKRIKTRLANQK